MPELSQKHTNPNKTATNWGTNMKAITPFGVHRNSAVTPFTETDGIRTSMINTSSAQEDIKMPS